VIAVNSPLYRNSVEESLEQQDGLPGKKFLLKPFLLIRRIASDRRGYEGEKSNPVSVNGVWPDPSKRK
jgi:hypothetical protein